MGPCAHRDYYPLDTENRKKSALRRGLSTEGLVDQFGRERLCLARLIDPTIICNTTALSRPS